MRCDLKDSLVKRASLALALMVMVAPTWAQTHQPGAHFIESWDVDGDGAVSLDDIIARRSDVFLSFDANDNGTLDAEEYVYFDEARANDMKHNAGPGGGLRRAAEGMTRVFNDTNGDGEVSRAEFLTHSSDWMALLDRNQDGHVTTTDFGQD